MKFPKILLSLSAILIISCNVNESNPTIELSFDINPDNYGYIVVSGLAGLSQNLNSDTLFEDVNLILDLQESGTFIAEAYPKKGYKFIDWNRGESYSMEFTPNKDLFFRANFSEKTFKLAENGYTVICDEANLGDTEFLEYLPGVTYDSDFSKRYELQITKRGRNDINANNKSRTCTSGITDMSELMLGVTSRGVAVLHYDVSNVTNMERMFHTEYAENYFGFWDVSNVKNMSGMFWGSTYMYFDYINDGTGLSKWNVSNVENMSDMFRDNKLFNDNIANWDVSKVTNMDRMFNNARDFNQDLSKWCVTNIPTEPIDFATGSALPKEKYPKWGTCPSK